MKPTTEQIEAALAYAADNETAWDNEIIDAWQQKKCVNNLLADRYAASAAILAAAYRELQEENKRLKPWADLAISSNALLEIERSERARGVARKEKP
jgi:thymidylate kinase